MLTGLDSMAADLGILLAITAMLSWGVADFLAKKAIDKIGYKTIYSYKPSLSRFFPSCSSQFFLQNALFSPRVSWHNCFRRRHGSHRLHFHVQRLRKRQRLRCSSDHRQLVSHNSPTSSSFSSRKHLTRCKSSASSQYFIGFFSPRQTLPTQKKYQTEAGGQREPRMP